MPYKSRKENTSLSLYVNALLTSFVFLIILSILIPIVYTVFKNSNFLESGYVAAINPIPCTKIYYHAVPIENGIVDWIEKEKVNADLCLPIEKVLEFNNSIKLAESISLIGIFVAIGGIMVPLLIFIVSQLQKNSIESELKTDIHKELRLIRDVLNNRANFLFDRLIEIVNFRKEYLNYLILTTNSLANRNNNSISLDSLLSKAQTIESALLNICTGNLDEINIGFSKIKDLIPQLEHINYDEDLKNILSILKYTLASFYKEGVFDTVDKEEILNKFLKERLNTDLSRFMN